MKRYYMICPCCDHVMGDYEVPNEFPDTIQCEFCGEYHDVKSILTNMYVNLTEEEKKIMREKMVTNKNEQKN